MCNTKIHLYYIISNPTFAMFAQPFEYNTSPEDDNLLSPIRYTMVGISESMSDPSLRSNRLKFYIPCSPGFFHHSHKILTAGVIYIFQVLTLLTKRTDSNSSYNGFPFYDCHNRDAFDGITCINAGAIINLKFSNFPVDASGRS